MQSESDHSIGDRIRIARSRIDLTQEELAARVRVSQPTVANWEHDAHQPRALALARLADALNVSRNWLLTGEDRAQATRPEPVRVADRYLDRPMRHVPILSWPEITGGFDPELATPRDFMVASIRAEHAFALQCQDSAMARLFPKGTLVVVDPRSKALEDGAVYLFHVAAGYVLRVWRDHPSRMEPAGDGAVYDTLFPSGKPNVVGRAILCQRRL